MYYIIKTFDTIHQYNYTHNEYAYRQDEGKNLLFICQKTITLLILYILIQRVYQ